MLSYPFYFMNMTLTADWDVILVIVSTLKQFPSIPNLRHVKGHQDCNRNIESMSLPAQLNVLEADLLAGLYRYDSQQNHTIIPRIAGNTVQLHLPQGTITSKLRPAVRKHASLPLTKWAIKKATNGQIASSTLSPGQLMEHVFVKNIPEYTLLSSTSTIGFLRGTK